MAKRRTKQVKSYGLLGEKVRIKKKKKKGWKISKEATIYYIDYWYDSGYSGSS